MMLTFYDQANYYAIDLYMPHLIITVLYQFIYLSSYLKDGIEMKICDTNSKTERASVAV